MDEKAQTAKKQFITNNVNKLSSEDHGRICTILIQNGKRKNIIYNKDGACVNLDILDDASVNSIYVFVEYTINKLNLTF